MQNNEKITKEDVINIMSNLVEEGEIISYQLKPITEKLGLLCEHAILYVNVLNGGRYSFFVKFCPDSPVLKTYVEDNSVFDRELFFNKTLFGYEYPKYHIVMENCIARYLYAKKDRFIVFENLSIEGFVPLEKRTFLNYETVVQVLQTLAKFHSSSLIYEEKKSKEIGRSYRLIEDFSNNLEENFYIEQDSMMRVNIDVAIKEILKLIDYFNLDEQLPKGGFKEMANQCCYKIFELIKSSKTFRNVIVHRDLWATNVMIKYNSEGRPQEARLVDFQVGKYSPPSQDVLSFIHLTTSREFRKQHLSNLLHLYYNLLKTNLAKNNLNIEMILPFEEFLDSCNEQKNFALVQTAHYLQMVILNNDILTKLFSDDKLLHRFMYESRNEFIESNIAKDEFYRQRLLETILDLKDFCQSL